MPRLCPRGSVAARPPRRHGQGLAGNGGIAGNPPKFGACLDFVGSHSTLGETGGAESPWAFTAALGILASQHLGVCCFVLVLGLGLVFFPPSVGKSWKEGLLGTNCPGACPQPGPGRRACPLPAGGRGSAAISLPPSSYRAPRLSSRL